MRPRLQTLRRRRVWNPRTHRSPGSKRVGGSPARRATPGGEVLRTARLVRRCRKVGCHCTRELRFPSISIASMYMWLWARTDSGPRRSITCGATIAPLSSASAMVARRDVESS